MSIQRLYQTFHETFALNTPSMGQILGLAGEHGRDLTVSRVRVETGLGNRYVDAMPRYLRGCGLLEFRSYTPTSLGVLVRRNDPNLTQPTTLWLMHYHMAAPHGPGPEYWSHFVTTRLPFGREVRITELTADLVDFVERCGHDRPQSDSVRPSATVFVGSYTKSDGLGRLGFLRETGRKVGRDTIYQVSGPQTPSTAVVCYALADYWEANYGQQTTVSLSELTRDTGFAKLLWMDSVGLDRVLELLRREGLVDLYKTAPPYQVVRLWSTKLDLLDRLYT